MAEPALSPQVSSGTCTGCESDGATLITTQSVGSHTPGALLCDPRGSSASHTSYDFDFRQVEVRLNVISFKSPRHLVCACACTCACACVRAASTPTPASVPLPPHVPPPAHAMLLLWRWRLFPRSAFRSPLSALRFCYGYLCLCCCFYFYYVLCFFLCFCFCFCFCNVYVSFEWVCFL